MDLSELKKRLEIDSDKLFKEDIVCCVCGTKARVLNGLTTCGKSECFNVAYERMDKRYKSLNK